MPLKIQCPGCRKIATVPDSATGKSAKCGCGQVITIPLVIADPPPTEARSDELSLQPLAPHPQQMHATPATTPAPRPSPDTPPAYERHRSTLLSPPNKTVDSDAAVKAFWAKHPRFVIGFVLVTLIIVGSAAPGMLRAFKADVDISKRRADNEYAEKKQVEEQKREKVVEKQRADDLHELMHAFDRTDAGKFLNRDNVRAIVYVVREKFPENRRAEAISDLLSVAKFSSDSWMYMKDPACSDTTPRNIKELNLLTEAWIGKDPTTSVLMKPDWNTLPDAVKTTLNDFILAYFSMSKEFWKKGTTVEAEALKSLGD